MERTKVRLKSGLHAFAFKEGVGLLAPPCSCPVGAGVPVTDSGLRLWGDGRLGCLEDQP